jgi:hypothetical protein
MAQESRYGLRRSLEAGTRQIACRLILTHLRGILAPRPQRSRRVWGADGFPPQRAPNEGDGVSPE